jgi:hypothetical protein
MWLGNAYDPVVWAMRFCPVPLFLLGVKLINHKKLPLLWFGQEGQLTVNEAREKLGASLMGCTNPKREKRSPVLTGKKHATFRELLIHMGKSIREDGFSFLWVRS